MAITQLIPPAELTLVPAVPAVRTQQFLTIEFRSPEGRVWTAIGGGDTLEEAIDWARESCPSGTTWEPVRRTDVYGD